MFGQVGTNGIADLDQGRVRREADAVGIGFRVNNDIGVGFGSNVLKGSSVGVGILASSVTVTGVETARSGLS